ncbi:MAG: hypothetical protein FIA92_14735 [Chloroflexi bacterium]|nr:hypothetical protein [Chloroflexota bacterium]
MALAATSVVLGSSPAPDATSRYVPDRVLVRFRGAPSETDLEIFRGRQFLTFVQYIGLSYPPGLGWYVFRIDDGMDVVLVRDLLRRDPMVCNVELVAIGEYFAIGLPDADEAPACVELRPSTPSQSSETEGPAAGGGTNAGPSDSTSQPLEKVAASTEVLLPILAAILVVVGLASWYRLRLRTRP